MNRTRFPARALAIALGCLSGGTAVAAPFPIDSEHKAAAGLVTSLHLANDTWVYHQVILERVIFYTNRALSTAASVTTPEQLMATPRGIEVPCGVSGSMTARMAPRFPRVFKFEWHDCHFDLFGWPHSLDGPGEVLLPSDTFSPSTVASIRFGNHNTDLVQTREVVTFDQINHDTLRRNLTLVGNIPLNFTQFVQPGTTLSFAYLIDGYLQETNDLEFPGSDRPPTSWIGRWDMDKVNWAGSFGYNDDATVYDDELRGVAGTLTFTRMEPPPYVTSVEQWNFAGLRIRSVTDWAGWTRDQWIDGKIDFRWGPAFGTGCVSGLHQFKTAAPLHNELNSQVYSSGDLTINGAARATFFSEATVPPELPAPTRGMLIRLEIPKVGTFNYDAPSVLEGVRSVSRCM